MTSPIHCRACGSTQVQVVLDLGIQPLANNLLKPDHRGQPEPRFPLRLSVCQSCWMAQIVDDVPPVTLFSEYLYFSSFSETMVQHARQAAERYLQEFGLNPSNLVIEIASNDGYLLRNFVSHRIPCLGIEPAANIAQVAQKQGIDTLIEFFGEDLARQLKQQGRLADLILGNNVFAHAPRINDFVAGLNLVLKPQGRIVLEFPYAVEMIQKREFDTIYHEHVFYFSLTALQPLFKKHGLDIFRVERLPIHGGSMRLFAAHRDAYPVEDSVKALLLEESSLGLASLGYYEGFSRNVHHLKEELITLLQRIKGEGKTIAAYGASAKGSTLLNFFGIGRDLLGFVADRSPHKQGRLTPGTHLPIVAPEMLTERQPDYTLLLTWNFAEEILAQQQSYRQRGGKFIIPIPEVKIV